MSVELHARKIFSDIKQQGITKYLRGQRQHGGQLWKVPIGSLVRNAQEEVLDQGSYLWTMKEQLAILESNWALLSASLQAHEEPPTTHELTYIQLINEVLGVESWL